MKSNYVMNKSIFLSLLGLTVITFLLSACSGNKNDESESHADHEHNATEGKVPEANAPQFDVPDDFQQQLGNVFASYTALKDAFVASDPENVRSEASSTSQAVGKVDMKLLKGPAHNDWMAYLTPINNSLKQIQESSDLETQREAFSKLSDNLYKSIKAFGLGGKEAFYDFCPMAFDNAGGYWLSDSEQIRNPYFGDKMLNCGVVKEKLQ
jgi:Cu(I)/Ag(I) efflux system membrane fusion protein